MPDNEVKIKIDIAKTGEGAKQAKAELDQVKDSANKADSSAGNLRTGMGGLTSALHGLSYILTGAQNGIRGIALATGGFFQLVFAHPIGRLVGALVTLCATLYTVISGLNKTKESLEEAKSKADIAAKALDKIAQTNLDRLTKSVSDLNVRLAQTLAETDAAVEGLKAMRDAELAVETAKVNKAVAAGEITPEEGERRKLLLKKESDTTQRTYEFATLKKQREEIEAVDHENRNTLQHLTEEKEKWEETYDATAEKALEEELVSPEELTAGDLSEPKKRAQEKKEKAESNLFRKTLLPFSNTGYEHKQIYQAEEDIRLVNQLEREQRLKDQAKKQYDANAPLLEKEIAQNALLEDKQQVRFRVIEAEQKSTDEELKASLQSLNIKEAQRKKTEELKLKRETLEREYQKAEESHNVGKAKELSQSVAAVEVQEYETSIMGTRVEPAMKEAEVKNIREKRARELEKFTAEEDKKDIIKRAELARDLQRTEEQNAKIHLNAAEQQAKDKKLTPSQGKIAKQNLATASATYGKEAAEAYQAEALVGKIRETNDPAMQQQMLRALESMTSANKEFIMLATNIVNQHTNEIKQQSSQLKNGDFRTK